MPKPRLIIVIRHAQSEGNKNRDIHQTIPDHRVKLTPLGWNQAHEAGRRLRAMLRPTDRLHFFTSPYRRTRETADGILETLTSPDDGPDGPSPFRRDEIKVYEEPRLREQDFGNFQPCSAEMERMWQERADYGHFFYRIPNGESAADAYDRVSGFNESLWRQFGEDDFADVCVLVTHGLMSRVFLMKWYHFTVEYFEDLRNINHCEFLLMHKDEETGKYALQNKLRTWSELRRERKTADGGPSAPHAATSSPGQDSGKLSRSRTFVSLRRWGGCPNGCNHKREYKRCEDLEALRQTDENANGSSASLTLVTRRKQRAVQRADDDDAASAPASAPPAPAPAPSFPFPTFASGPGSQHHPPAAADVAVPPHIDVKRALEEDDCSSPDGTPSFISAEDRLRSLRSPHVHIGRDGGGTYSGHASLSGTDDELSGDEEAGGLRAPPSSGAAVVETRAAVGVAAAAVVVKQEVEERPAGREARVYADESGMGHGAKAHRLGDCSLDNSDNSDDGEGGPGVEDEDGDEALARLEREEKSVLGSVY